MPNTYWEAHYHFVWSTHERAPLVTTELEPHLFRYIRHKCRELGVVVHALNGTPDHLHLAASVPPRLAIADFIHDVKGSSSRFVNDRHGGHEFHWQEGYAVLTLANAICPSWSATSLTRRNTTGQANSRLKWSCRTSNGEHSLARRASYA